MLQDNEDFKSIDKSNMFEILQNFCNQIKEAISIGTSSPIFNISKIKPQKFIILGMGGSAIGGDLLRSYFREIDGASHLEIIINRNYTIPEYIDNSWFVIASSYSGGTEETISAYNLVKEKTKNILAITSGGELARIAENDGFPIIRIPAGLMPRCALGYSFFTMLMQLIRLGAVDETTANIIKAQVDETLSITEAKAKDYSQIKPQNLAYSIAEKLKGKIPVVYSADTKMDVVNLRWRGQLQENAKNLAFGAYLPEMNHNEINSWSFPQNLIQNFIFILLQDKEDHPQIRRRFEAIAEIFSQLNCEVISLESSANSLLARMFDMIYLGDWVSYWLALLNGVDPTPIPLISKLKSILSR